MVMFYYKTQEVLHPCLFLAQLHEAEQSSDIQTEVSFLLFTAIHTSNDRCSLFWRAFYIGRYGKQRMRLKVQLQMRSETKRLDFLIEKAKSFYLEGRREG